MATLAKAFKHEHGSSTRQAHTRHREALKNAARTERDPRRHDVEQYWSCSLCRIPQWHSGANSASSACRAVRRLGHLVAIFVQLPCFLLVLLVAIAVFILEGVPRDLV